jgi:hypothetical protein
VWWSLFAYFPHLTEAANKHFSTSKSSTKLLTITHYIPSTTSRTKSTIIQRETKSVNYPAVAAAAIPPVCDMHSVILHSYEKTTEIVTAATSVMLLLLPMLPLV